MPTAKYLEGFYLSSRIPVSVSTTYSDSFRGALHQGMRVDAESSRRRAALLVKSGIKESIRDIQGVPSVNLAEDGTITGRFGDSRRRVYDYKITPSNKLSYRFADRKDSGQADDCKLGLQCGKACVPSNRVCEADLSPTAVRAFQLARQTLETEKIPTKIEITKFAGVIARELISNPAKFIREANAREEQAMMLLELAGYEHLSSKSALIGKVTEKPGMEVISDFVKNNPEAVEDAIVNTGGYLASKAGAAAGGLPGQLAGDLGGALVTRKVITDIKAVKRAYEKTQGADEDGAFSKLNALQKAGKIASRSVKELNEMEELRKENKLGDVTGFVIGNAGAQALDALPVPFKGAGVAYALSPAVKDGYKRIKAGEDGVAVVADVGKRILTMPIRAIQDGFERERKYRESLEQKIRDAKSLPVDAAIQTVKERAKRG